MKVETTLLNNTAIYAVGNLGSKVLSFALVPIFSFFVSKEDLGLYDLFLTSISLFFPIVTIQLSEAMYRWILSESNILELNKIISTGVFTSFICLVVFGLFYACATYFYSFKYDEYFYILLLGSSLFPTSQQILRGLGKSKLYSFIGILNVFLLILLNFVFLYYYKLGIEGVFIASICSYTLSIVVSVWKGEVIKYLKFNSFDLKEVRNMLNYSLPLIPNAISWWFINAANRFLILYGMGLDANGIFAISSRFPAILAILNSIFMLAWQDVIIQNSQPQKSNNFAFGIFNKFLKLELCIMILLIPICRFLTAYTVESSFEDSWKYMPLLFLGTAFSAFSAFFGSMYLQLKNTKALFTTTLIGGLINILITYILIPHIGLFAPGVGTLIGFISVFLLRVKNLVGIFNKMLDWKSLIILSILSIILFLLALIDEFYIHILIFTFGVILTFILNKSLISTFTTFLNGKIKSLSK